MSLVLVTAPTVEPLELSEAEAHLRVDDGTETALISTLIAAARDYAESQTGRALLEQTWRYTADAFPHCNGVIKLRRAPLIAVTSIQYVDTNGVTQTLTSNQYLVNADAPLGEISPAYGVSWPATRPQPAAVTVTFTAGYADPDSVPASIKAAMLLTVGELYENREASVDAAVRENPAVCALLDPWRLPVL